MTNSSFPQHKGFYVVGDLSANIMGLAPPMAPARDMPFTVTMVDGQRGPARMALVGSCEKRPSASYRGQTLEQWQTLIAACNDPNRTLAIAAAAS